MKTKIKAWLQDEIQSAQEVIAEYTSDHRPKCEDGSDDFIEGNLNLAQRLLLQIFAGPFRRCETHSTHRLWKR